MQQAPNSELIQKIKKMLTLANDSGATEAEAATALSMANNMLVKYNLSMVDVEHTENDPSIESVGEFAVELISQHRWQNEVVHAIARHNFCTVLEVEKKSLVGQTRATYQLVGHKTNLEVATLLIKWVIKNIHEMGYAGYRAYKASDEYVYGWGDRSSARKWCNSFGEGAASRIRERLQEMREAQLAAERSATEASGDEIRALVVSSDTAVRDYLEQKYPWRKEERLRREAWQRKAEAARAEREAWEREHPEEVEAQRVAEAARQAEEEAADEAKRAARRKYEEAFFKKNGYYPGEGRRRAEYRSPYDWSAYDAGSIKANEINLAPGLSSSASASSTPKLPE